jgi:hypothetical protein
MMDDSIKVKVFSITEGKNRLCEDHKALIVQTERVPQCAPVVQAYYYAIIEGILCCAIFL